MNKILQVMGGMSRAGAETFIMNVYRHIDRTEFQFDFLVYTNEHQDFEDEIERLGGEVLHIPLKQGVVGAIKSITQIRRVIRDNGPYIAIHAQTLHNIAFPLLSSLSFPGVVRIAHSHNTHNRTTTNFTVRLYESVTKWIIRQYAHVWLACGEEAGEYLFGKKFKEKGIVVNNGIDLTRFLAPDEVRLSHIRKEFDLGGKLVIGSVARLQDVKNHDFMIDIAYYLKKKGVAFKMLFAGRGELKDTIQSKIDGLGLSQEVVLMGIRSDIADLMNVFDVFLMPSKFEGNPVTLVEAQAASTPCVISDTITDQMDLGLGLIYKKSLSDTADIWADEIVNTQKSPKPNEDNVRVAFHERRYDIQSTVELVSEIYLKGKNYGIKK